MKSLLAYILGTSLFISTVVEAQNYVVEQYSAIPFKKSLVRVGTVAFKRTSKLSFKSSGYLEKLTVDEGDFFTDKQLLASLSTEEIKAEKNSRYIQLLQAKREVNRIKKLMEQELSSQQALDVAQTTVDTTREAYQIAYYNLEKAEIYAPFSGVVLSRKTEVSEFQSPGKEVLEIAASENNLVVKVGLTSNEIGFVEQGQNVQVTTMNSQSTSGVISKIPVISNTSGQLYLIEVMLNDVKAGEGVISGQQAQATIDFSSDKLVYEVPITALVEMDSFDSAVIVTRTDDQSFAYRSFDVIDMDNKNLYLKANNQNEQLSVVVSGWQQLDVVGQ